MSKTISDRDLMARFGRKGDRAAFVELARRWDGRVLGYLAKACGDFEAAEDLRQEVFVRIYRFGSTYDPKFSFSAWLFRVVANTLHDWRTKERRRQSRETARFYLPKSAEPADTAPDARQRLAQRESHDRVREAVARLAGHERELLLMRFDLDFSYRKIGEILETPETTIKSRIYTLLGALRVQLQETEAAEGTARK